MPDLVTIGETMVVLNPVFRGPLSSVSMFRRSIGGAESNVAIAAARLGISAGWISRLGDDEMGRYVLKTIRGEGVDTRHVMLDSDARTGVYFKELRGNQEPYVYYYRAGSAASKMRPEDLDPSYFSSARVLYVSGITPALSKSCCETVFAALEIAREYSVTVAFDPNIRLKLWTPDEARRILLAIARQSDMLFPDLDEARMLLERPSVSAREAAMALADLTGAKKIAITMGSEGAYVLADGQEYKKGAYSIPVVDPIGAGDAFVGAFLASWLKGKTDAECLDVGCAAGALAVTVEGDYEALPDWSQVDSLRCGRKIVAR